MSITTELAIAETERITFETSATICRDLARMCASEEGRKALQSAQAAIEFIASQTSHAKKRIVGDEAAARKKILTEEA